MTTSTRQSTVSSVPRRLLRRRTPVVLAVLAAALSVLPLGCGDEEPTASREARTSATRERTATVPPVTPFQDSGPPRTAAERRRRVALRREQRAVTVALSGDEPVEQTELAITREARARHARGELDDRVRRTVCDPPRDLGAGRRGTNCIASTASGSGVVVGVPFAALIESAPPRVTFCKRNITPGEGSRLPEVRVPLPAPCRLGLLGR